MAEENNTNNQNPDSGQNGQPQQNPAPQIDYGKIAEIVANGTAQKESAILKSYFTQQGMSAEEMTAAIAAYKEQKAKNFLDICEIQTQL